MIEPQSMQLGASAWVWKLTLVAPKLSVIGAALPPFPFVVLPFPLPSACPLAAKAPFVAMTASGSAAGSAAGAAATDAAETEVAFRASASLAGGRSTSEPPLAPA